MSKFAYVALCGAAMSLAMSAPATAQDAAAMTAGGDVTADEATPLPPVVVEAPSQPIARKAAKKKTAASSGPTTIAATPAEGQASGASVPAGSPATTGRGAPPSASGPPSAPNSESTS